MTKSNISDKVHVLTVCNGWAREHLSEAKVQTSYSKRVKWGIWGSSKWHSTDHNGQMKIEIQGTGDIKAYLG